MFLCSVRFTIKNTSSKYYYNWTGEGCNSAATIHLAQHRASGQYCALKQFNLDLVDEAEIDLSVIQVSACIHLPLLKLLGSYPLIFKVALIMPFAAYTGTDSCKNSMNDQSACFFLCVCINITRSQQLSYFDYLLYSMNYWWVERCNMIISWRRCAYLPLVLRYAPYCRWPATVSACNFQIAPNGCSVNIMYMYIHV